MDATERRLDEFAAEKLMSIRHVSSAISEGASGGFIRLRVQPIDGILFGELNIVGINLSACLKPQYKYRFS